MKIKILFISILIVFIVICILYYLKKYLKNTEIKEKEVESKTPKSSNKKPQNNLILNDYINLEYNNGHTVYKNIDSGLCNDNKLIIDLRDVGNNKRKLLENKYLVDFPECKREGKLCNNKSNIVGRNIFGIITPDIPEGTLMDGIKPLCKIPKNTLLEPLVLIK